MPVATKLLSELMDLVLCNLFRVYDMGWENRTFNCKCRCDMTFCLTDSFSRL